ncbi:hypothetical protein [Ammoniphilus sp. CFH 90114]|uniref:hypothetical protein n=1 Tax=Ammoniphilus sp. CFH 90114 TaxID=2493665 RepID=UPI00100EBCE6|nr:hypothetical protein [Ammoniphilus sp. CFH 90114]RXT07859.1 hypothetical protein EIZ39_10565 [Ammoniphilus sp. CFH 90114]
MEWEIYHISQQTELEYNEAEGDAILHCQVPQAAEHFKKLLDGATQATLDFDGGELEGQSVIGFRLRNANGEFYIALLKKDWNHLLEQPDEVVFQYGEGEKGQFSSTFYNGMFEQFLDRMIDRYNAGEKTTFTEDIIEVFGEED